jgi:hypothetical protein
MLNILFGFVAGAVVAFVLLAAYYPGFVSDTRRYCFKCGKHIARGHRWYHWHGKPRHINCADTYMVKEQRATLQALDALIETGEKEEAAPAQMKLEVTA